MAMGFKPRKFFPLYIVMVRSSTWKSVSDQRMKIQPRMKQEVFPFFDTDLKTSGFDRRIQFDDFNHVETCVHISQSITKARIIQFRDITHPALDRLAFFLANAFFPHRG